MNQPFTNLARVAERDLARAADEAQPRGRRAARLRLAKAYVLHHLAESGLNADKVGRRLAISGRTVQMLFEAEGTTFSAYVLEQRLLEALRRLRDPRLDTEAISQIAYAAGFVDLSHFNRCFRVRFGDTPSGVRNNAA
jgi:AraC-like DNA-binding protein